MFRVHRLSSSYLNSPTCATRAIACKPRGAPNFRFFSESVYVGRVTNDSVAHVARQAPIQEHDSIGS